MVGGGVPAWRTRVLERGEFVLLENVVRIAIGASGRLGVGCSLVVKHCIDVLGID
jgi:hypothetical protein